MSNEDKKFIIACILGDGCINSRIINNTVQCRFMLRHSNKQFDYFIWKVNELKRILDKKQAKNSEYSYEDNSGRSKILSVRFERNHPYFKTLHKFIYPNNKKTFSKKVLNRLNAKGLAIWFMDDGSLYNAKYNNKYSKCTARLNTYLSKEENEIIIKYFMEKWNIRWVLEKEKQFYRLRCNTTEFRKFVEIIKDYIVPSMFYKINIKVGQEVTNNTYPLPDNAEGEDIVQIGR
jgi:hypothetical protein